MSTESQLPRLASPSPRALSSGFTASFATACATAVLLLAACGQKSDPPPRSEGLVAPIHGAAPEGTDPPGGAPGAPPNADLVRSAVDGPDAQAAPRPSASEGSGRAEEAVAALLDATVGRVRARVPAVDAAATWRAAADRQDAPFARFLVRAQTRFGGTPILLREEAAPGLSEALLAALNDLEAHAVDPTPYDRDGVVTALGRAGDLVEVTAEQRLGPFQDEEGKALWQAALLTLDAAPRDQVFARLAGAGDEDDVRERLPLVEKWLVDAATADAARAKAWMAADVRALVAFARYAMDFRYLRSTNPYRKPDVFDERLDQVAGAILKHVEAARSDMGAALATLRPTHPLYDRVRAFLPKYRALAAAPDGERPKEFKTGRRLKKGKHGPEAAALRERLRAEGYDPGPPSDRFDEALTAAVIEFQETHGVAPLGEVGPQTTKVLNVTMERRLKQLTVSLQRWRENPIGHATGRHVRINLPEYELQLWEDDRIVERHKVIVGSGAVVTDLTKKTIGYLNRTRTLDSALYQIILNPYWRVPKRIAVQEIGPEAESDPKYLESHGFRLTSGPGGEPLYVQSPGPKNPLGRVKFLFENDFALYLHDTDKRWLFKETQRDFSHGCVRVHEPLDLAFTIASKVNAMTRDEFDRLLRMGTEYGIDLKEKLPIYLDYNTVSVDDEGRLLLLPDVYGFDRGAIRGRLPVNQFRSMKPAELARAQERVDEKKKAKKD